MEPLDEKELNQLLQRWEAPAAPNELRERLAPPAPSWRWLLTGSIRIPVPVGLAIIVAVVVWVLASRTPAPVVQPAASNSLADFQPVRQLEPKIVTKDENSDERNEPQHK